MGRTSLYRVVGTSPAAQALREEARRAARSEDPVLLTGEPGCGKARVARTIHAWSRRRKGPFRRLDCSRHGERQLEQRLLGARGRAAEGLLERADGGTLYLGAFEELPAGLQAAVLDLVETGCFRRPRALVSVRADVRIVGGTAKDMGPFVNGGLFSRRLYAHLSRNRIAVPSLRRRIEDIPEIVADLCGGRIPPRLDGSVLQAFQRYPWPGNLEELEEEVERLLRTGYPKISAEHVRRDIVGYREGGGAADPGVQRVVEELETAIREFRLLGWLDREFGEFLLDLEEEPEEEPDRAWDLEAWDCDPA